MPTSRNSKTATTKLLAKPVDQKVQKLVADIEDLIAWPREGYPRRTEDGFPTEFAYDEYAYQRMITSYREAMQKILDSFKK